MRFDFRLLRAPDRCSCPLSLPLALICGVLVAGAWSRTDADAQQPCRGMLEFADAKADESLVLGNARVATTKIEDETKAADPGVLIDEVQLIVDTSAVRSTTKLKCVWVALKQPGEDNFPGFATFLLQPEERVFKYVPVGSNGEYCFRFVLIAEDRRGAPIDRCVTVTSSRPLITASDNQGGATLTAPRPPATGSPGQAGGSSYSINWIAPAALGVFVGVAITLLAVRRYRPR